MTIDRRRFVSAAMAAAAPLVVPLRAGALTLDAMELEAASTNECAFASTHPFDRLVGEVFKLNANNGATTEARLVYVDTRKMNCEAHPRPANLRSQTTTIRFEAVGHKKLDDAIYQVRHAQLQPEELFLTAAPDSSGQMVLEAIVN